MNEDPNAGCLGCGGCLSAVGAFFVWVIVAYFTAFVLGILITVAATVGLVALVVAIVRWTGNKRYAIVKTPAHRPVTRAPQQPTRTTNPLKGYNSMGDFTPVDTVRTIEEWASFDLTKPLPPVRSTTMGNQPTQPTQVVPISTEDEEFIRFAAAFPVGSIWRSKKDPDSYIKVRIIAVDHRWTGQQKDLVIVIVTFEELQSKHRFHWPVKAFDEFWIYDQPATRRARRSGHEIDEPS